MALTARSNRLVDRICQQYEGDLSFLNIPVNRFHGALSGLLFGKFTTAQVENFFQFSTEELADWNVIIGRITSYANTLNTNSRDRAVDYSRTILIFFEDGGIPGYLTPDEIWNHFLVL